MSKKSNQNSRALIKIPNLNLVGQPTVDILTPVYGSPDLLKILIDTVLSYKAGADYRWWIIDDKGPKSESLTRLYAILKRYSQCSVIPPTKNRGFAGANNEAAKQGNAPYILLLNSDVKVTHDDWLARLLAEIEVPSVGVVGAKLLYFEDSKDPARPAGMTQHAGVAFNLIGQPYHIFMGWHPYHPKVHLRREMNCVTGACLMTKRQLYFKLGGLDEDYGPGNFEDVQYCIQARMDDQKVIYTPEVTLEHFAGGSNNTARAKLNESLFHIKIGNYVEYDEYRYLDVKHTGVPQEVKLLGAE